MSDTPQPDPNAGRNAPNDPDAVRREEIARQEEADRLQSGQPVEREVPALNEQQRQEQERAAQERQGQNNPDNTGDQAAQERENQGSQGMPDPSGVGDRRGEDAGDGGQNVPGQTPDEELPGDGGSDSGTTTTTTTTTEGGDQNR